MVLSPLILRWVQVTHSTSVVETNMLGFQQVEMRLYSAVGKHSQWLFGIKDYPTMTGNPSFQNAVKPMVVGK